MKRILFPVVFLWSVATIAQETLTSNLPARVDDYKLSSPGMVDDSYEEFRAQHIIYKLVDGDSYEDNLFISYQIFHEDDAYQKTEKDFTFDDMMAGIESMNFSDPGQLADMLTTDLSDKSDEEVMEEEMDYKHIDDFRFTKAWYLDEKNIAGHHTFRAVLFWGDKQYAEVKARNEKGNLNVEDLLMFIRNFPFEEL